jgi:hypothetical protein
LIFPASEATRSRTESSFCGLICRRKIKVIQGKSSQIKSSRAEART